VTVKSIIDVEIDPNGKFRAFKDLYDKYQTALKGAPAAWKLVEKNIDGSRESFQKLVDQMAAANVQARLREKAQERADQLTRTSADRWQAMARNTREFASNIKEATVSLLKWGSITGVISGLIGAGGLWGIDRLALSAGQSRRSALGLGLGIGEQQAFGANFGRLVDPDAFLSGVAGAKFDVTKRVGLLGAGLTQQDLAGDTAQTAVALLRRLKQIADTTNPALFAQVLQARRLDQFAAPTDLERLRNTSPQEFEQLIRQYGQRQRQFDLPADVAKRWQDFSTQMENAGKSIETVLIRGLAPLAPGLTKLSEGVEKVIASFLGSPALGKWLQNVDDALEKFAGYIGTDDFQRKVENFVDGIGAAGAALAKWFGGPQTGATNPESALKTNRQGLFGQQPENAGQAKANAWFNYLLGTGTRTNAITPDELLGLVRQKEGSGDRSVSPAGAVGRYQIMPGTGMMYGASPQSLFDPKTNEETAKKILADLIKRYHGNVSEILAAYNAGPKRADDYRRAGDNPAVLPRETQKYIGGTQGMTVRIENNTGGNATVTTNALKD
jgi:transglycosylase-like protein with SLT domain